MVVGGNPAPINEVQAEGIDGGGVDQDTSELMEDERDMMRSVIRQFSALMDMVNSHMGKMRHYSPELGSEEATQARTDSHAGTNSTPTKNTLSSEREKAKTVARIVPNERDSSSWTERLESLDVIFTSTKP